MSGEPVCKAKGCAKPSEPGLAVCRQHGGGWPQARRKSEVVKAQRELDAFIAPIAEDDPETDVFAALQMEHRRTVAKIRWLEHRIAATMGAADLEWGLSSEERITASETPGTNRTYAAQVPVLLQLLEKERAHLLRLHEVMGRNSYRAAEAEIRQRANVFLVNKVVELLTAVKRDPHDPRVRRAVFRVFGNEDGERAFERSAQLDEPNRGRREGR